MDNVALTFPATKRVADDPALVSNGRLWRDSLGQILATAAAHSSIRKKSLDWRRCREYEKKVKKLLLGNLKRGRPGVTGGA
jgi:hypothetical protein